MWGTIMEVSRVKKFYLKTNLLLFICIVLINSSPVTSRRQRYRLLPALEAYINPEAGSSSTTTTQSPSDGIRINPRRLVLDSETGLNLTWAVNPNLRLITLTIESNKKSGHVALVLTRQGQEKLEGADVIVIGKRTNGTNYVLDMHGLDDDTIAQDHHQDWRLDLDDSQSRRGMRISIRRNLDSCDDKDVVIGNEKINLAFDQGDDIVPARFEPGRIIQVSFVDKNLPLESGSSKCSLSGVTDSSITSRDVRTASAIEYASSATTDSPRTTGAVARPQTELEPRSIEQDPADDRYSHVGYYKWFPKLALAHLRIKYILSKFPKHYIKFKYIK